MVLLIPHKGREGEREGKGRRTPKRRSKRKGNKNGQEEREIEGQQKKMDGAPNTPQGEQMNENNAGCKIEIIDNEWKNYT